MIEGGKVLQDIATRVAATTADTSHDGTKRFKHIRQVYDPLDLLDIKAPSRKFIVLPTGSRQLVGFIGQEGEMTSVSQTFDVHIVYRQGDAMSLFKRIVEDVDQLGRALMKTADWDATTNLERRRVESYSLAIDDQAGGTALLTIPVTCRYTPSYT